MTNTEVASALIPPIAANPQVCPPVGVLAAGPEQLQAALFLRASLHRSGQSFP